MISTKTESTPQRTSIEDQAGQKLFDNYGPVNVKETIGTLFLGVLAICLFIALQRTWNQYEAMFKQEKESLFNITQISDRSLYSSPYNVNSIPETPDTGKILAYPAASTISNVKGR